MEIIAARSFSQLYIYLDTAFIVVFALLLLYRKKYLTLIFALAGGLLYFAVDYGIFHLWTHSRTISGGSMFWVLLWMSLSYGFTNFAWIWLCLSKDKNLKEWTVLILGWWICCPLIADTFGTNFTTVEIARTTGAYHGYMALILFVSYLAVITYNLAAKEKDKRFKIIWLCVIGIAVQFGWEFALLAGGIRSNNLSFPEQLKVLAVNSLVETNLGMPAIYMIFLAVTAKYREDLKRRPSLSLSERLKENNAETFKRLAVAEVDSRIG